MASCTVVLVRSQCNCLGVIQARLVWFVTGPCTYEEIIVPVEVRMSYSSFISTLDLVEAEMSRGTQYHSGLMVILAETPRQGVRTGVPLL